MANMIIKNGSVVFESEVKAADILVEDEKIAAIYEPGKYNGDAKVLDAAGLTIFPGSIDPHMHLDNHLPLAEAVYKDSRRQAIGGLTTMVPYVKANKSYLEAIPKYQKTCEENSVIDFGFSCFLFAKQHEEEIEQCVKDLGITSFKFIFDKQDVVHLWYDITKEDALTLDKGDFYRILKKLRSIDKKLMLCVHSEDPDIFRMLEAEVKEAGMDNYSLATYDKVRPAFCETTTMADLLYLNSVLDGNVYMVHTASGDSIKMYETMQKAFPSSFTVETCPQYLTMTVDSPCGILAKVNPPIHFTEDVEALWEGIRCGTVQCMGTDNVPAYLAQKQAKGDDLWAAALGFSTPGLILPVLISEGYHKRNIPLTTIANISARNTAKKFLLECKGEIKVGYDADFAIVDLNWERTISPDLYGCSDYSIYDKMTFKGWPRYTIIRGNVIQKDGEIVANDACGKYISRSL